MGTGGGGGGKGWNKQHILKVGGGRVWFVGTWNRCYPQLLLPLLLLDIHIQVKTCSFALGLQIPEAENHLNFAQAIF